MEEEDDMSECASYIEDSLYHKQNEVTEESGLLNAPRNSLIGKPFRSLQLQDRIAAFTNGQHDCKRRKNETSQEKFATILPHFARLARFHDYRCSCGRPVNAHRLAAFSSNPSVSSSSTSVSTQKEALGRRWNILEHTVAYQTDAFGTLEFFGGAHAHKAQYIRLSYDCDPADIIYLLENVWHLAKPRLVITVQGGLTNFDMEPFSVNETLARVFREGLLKAALTTGAWIITNGTDLGVVRHVAAALDEAGISARMRSTITLIGIVPWGLLKSRHKLIGRNIVVPYDHYTFSSNSKCVTLNDRHSYFLLADNGTSGRYGADTVLRRRFEQYIASEKEPWCGIRRIPVVCVVLEGGSNAIQSLTHYLISDPPTPIIVCDGSGRAADLISFVYNQIWSDGNVPADLRMCTLNLVKKIFINSAQPAESICDQIIFCAEHRELVRIFGLENEKLEDMDRAILTAILKSQNFKPAEQLSLALSWNRVDIARSDIFTGNQQWSTELFHNAMMDALVDNRIEFVKLFIENGVSPRKFLTVERLEQLYNAEHFSRKMLLILAKKNVLDTDENLTLADIGLIIEKWMGSGYRSIYRSLRFRKFEKCKTSQAHRKAKVKRSRKSTEDDFEFPYNELLAWAILTQRQEMASFLWMYGEDAMAKALAAVRLYKCFSREMATEFLELEISKQLREYSQLFQRRSLDLLNHCYKLDDAQTIRLLTADLKNWSHHTCLSLAVVGNNKDFLAHPCCQILLAELWNGRLGIRSHSNLKVILALAFPPAILLFDLKTKTPKRGSVWYSARKNCGNKDESKDGDIKLYEEVARYNDRRRSIVSRIYHPKFGCKTQGNPRYSKGGKFSEAKLEDGDQESERTKDNGLSYDSHSTSYVEQRSKWIDRFTVWSSKVSEFYSAPVTTFWAWSLSFAVFLFALTYIVLIEFSSVPANVEWFLLSYVSTLCIEQIRKLLNQEASTLREKIWIYFDRYWNYLTIIAITTYFIGFGFRLQSSTTHSYGRIILACNAALWYIKVLDFMSVNHRLGPYINMAGKMILNMSYIIVLLLVILMAFGTCRQSITYPHEKWNWILIRNIFYKPYFMLYGEVYAGEIDTCGDEGTNCVPGSWIPPILMTVFLLIANILFINLLIAIFNNIFNETNAISQQVWLLQRYKQVMEYNNTPFIPPPLTPIAYIISIIRHLYKLRSSGSNVWNKKKDDPDAYNFAMSSILVFEILSVALEFYELHKSIERRLCCDELISSRKT